jgi:hypothetical protein
VTAFCPYCGRTVAGLLAGCDQAACRTRELDDDHTYARGLDQ